MLKLFAVTLQIMLEIFLTVAKTPFILFLLHLTRFIYDFTQSLQLRADCLETEISSSPNACIKYGTTVPFITAFIMLYSFILYVY